MKYIYALLVVAVLVGVCFVIKYQSNTEPVQGVLMTNLDNVQGLTKIGGNCEQ